MRLVHDGYGTFTVLRNDDDPIDALGDAVAHLFELTVGVLVGVALDDGMSRLRQGCGDRLVTRDPELGLEVLKGKADRGGLGATGPDQSGQRGGGEGGGSHGFSPFAV